MRLARALRKPRKVLPSPLPSQWQRSSTDRSYPIAGCTRPVGGDHDCGMTGDFMPEAALRRPVIGRGHHGQQRPHALCRIKIAERLIGENPVALMRRMEAEHRFGCFHLQPIILFSNSTDTSACAIFIWEQYKRKAADDPPPSRPRCGRDRYGQWNRCRRRSSFSKKWPQPLF